MLCIFFGIGKITTLGKAMCLFCLKDIGSQINVTAARQSSSRWCPNYKRKEQKKEKYKAFGNEMLFLIPTKHKYLNSLVTSSTQQNEFWASKHQSMTLKHSMNINSYVATQNWIRKREA